MGSVTLATKVSRIVLRSSELTLNSRELLAQVLSPGRGRIALLLGYIQRLVSRLQSGPQPARLRMRLAQLTAKVIRPHLNLPRTCSGQVSRSPCIGGFALRRTQGFRQLDKPIIPFAQLAAQPLQLGCLALEISGQLGVSSFSVQ